MKVFCCVAACCKELNADASAGGGAGAVVVFSRAMVDGNQSYSRALPGGGGLYSVAAGLGKARKSWRANRPA